MINTVLGKKKIEDLGYILPHEHIFIDLTNEFSEPKNPEMAKICYDEISLKNVGYIKLNPYLMKDNFILDNEDIMTDELKIFKAHGGGTIIDNTNIGINRDPLKLKRMAEKTGVNIICGSGYYTGDTFPSDFSEKRENDIAEEILNEFRYGISVGLGGQMSIPPSSLRPQIPKSLNDFSGTLGGDATPQTYGLGGQDCKIFPGIIGEIGTSKVISENEKKSLCGAAIACKELHAPMQVHLHPWGTTGIDVINILKPFNLDFEKVVICHTDVELNIEYMEKLLDMGVYVQFDNIAKEFFKPADMLMVLLRVTERDVFVLRNSVIRDMLHKSY